MILRQIPRSQTGLEKNRGPVYPQLRLKFPVMPLRNDEKKGLWPEGEREEKK